MGNYIAYKSKTSQARAIACYDETLSKWPVKYESHFLKTSFGATHIVISGKRSAKPLILLHGAGGNAGMWIHNIAELSKHFRIYAIDIIGEPGKSAGNRPNYYSEEHALWLREIFELLNLRDAVLCGISLGGWMACQFGLKFPELISDLILVSPPAILNTNMYFLYRMALASLMPMPFFVMEFIKYISCKARSLPESTLQSFITTWQAYNPNTNAIPPVSNSNIRNLPTKTLMILGEEEVMYCSNEAAEHISNVSTNVKVVIIPQAGHIVTYDQPNLLNKEIINFVN